MLPVYREGDIIIVSPERQRPQGRPRRREHRDGEVMAKKLQRRTAKTVELRALNPAHQDRVLPLNDIAWMARIIWASQ